MTCCKMFLGFVPAKSFRKHPSREETGNCLKNPGSRLQDQDYADQELAEAQWIRILQEFHHLSNYYPI
ncbi:hypothetical protein Hanom_Chr13g01217091 [Helianthus anomalus]